MKYIETYRGWQIYFVSEAFYSTPQNKMLDIYIAIEPDSHSCIDDVTLGSIKSGITETLRNS